jgi:hypothetical protein
MRLRQEWQEYTEGVTEEWDLEGTLHTPEPKNVFTAAAEAVAEMGGAEKLKEQEDPPIIL